MVASTSHRGRKSEAESLSGKLTWKEFETFSALAFSSLGFKTKVNFRLRRPRAEIDLVASKNRFAFAVDCKHWKRTVGHATMINISDRQINRAKRLVEAGSSFARVMPVILTWHDESLHILENGVPIVPIHKVSDFILNWEESADRITIVKSDSGGFRF
ncbi:MAG: restriction endonuclease [Nitrososphaerales archaeon]